MSGRSDSIRVLQVDDDRDLAETAALMLERADDRLSVETVPDAAAALDRLAGNGIDCVVSDYEMPGRNGIELLRAVREAHPNLPFVLFTGKGTEEVASEAISAGVTDYLQKQATTDQYAVLSNRIVNAVERYRARRELVESRQRFRTLVEEATDAIMVLNPAVEIEYATPAVERIMAHTPEELLGTNGLDYVHPEDVERVGEVFAELVDDPDGVAAAEFRLRHADGHWVWAESRGRNLLDDPLIGGIVVYMRDVTERHEHARAVEELHGFAADLTGYDTASAVCRRTVEAAETVLDFDNCVVNLEADGVLHIEAMSEALPPEDARPMSVEEGLVGKTYRTGESFVVDDLRDSEAAEPKGPYTAALSIPIGDHGVFQAVRTDDGTFDDRDRELAELLVSHADHALDRLERERQLKRQNERLERFSSIVSHDLQSPLNVAKGRLEMVRDECDSEHIDTVERAHDRMAELIEDLLAMAREGDAATETGPIDLAETTRECWENIETGDATLVVGTDRVVRADERRIKQLLANLLRNAVEYGVPDDPDATGATVTVGDLADGFYVADDGPGIPETERDRVFELGHSTAEGGTGFGLAIVKRVADAHGWDVAIAESAGGGARFEVRGVEFVDGDG